MNAKINRYDLKDGFNEQILKDSGFKYNDKYSLTNIKTPVYSYFKFLIGDIELHLEIGLNENGTFSFDDYENVLVLDDSFCQPYTPFYSEDADFPFLNKVIEKYNEAMEELAEKGILVERGIIDKKVIFADYPDFKITEETRRKVIENPLRHLNCPPRIRMGKFYTDEEYQKYIEESLKRPLPGDNQSSRKRKK